MPLEDFLTGTVLFLLMLLAVLATTGLVVQRRLAHLDRLERLLAATVVGTAVLIAVHLVPMLLGILSQATVLVASALAVAIATRVKVAAPAPPDGPRDDAPPAPSSRLEWALAAIASAVVTVAAVADLKRWATNELVGIDPLTFHLPNIGRWIQTGSLWQIDQFVPLQAQGNYPNNGDVVMLSTVLPWHNDFLVRAPICFFLVLTGVAVAAIARELRAPPAAVVLAGAAIVSVPIVGLASVPRALPDALQWATYACGTLFLLRHARSARRSDLWLAAVALAIAAGTKWYGVTAVGVLVAVWIVARLLQRDVPRKLALGEGALLAVVAGLGEAVWAARNLVESGNPLFSAKVAVFGITIFDAPRDVIRERVGFSVLDYLGDPSVLPQLGGQIFEGLGVLAIVCVIGLGVAAFLNRRPPDRRVWWLTITAVVLVPVYASLPYTALGLRGNPSLASGNTRYAVPALLLALPLVAWAIGRLPRWAAVGLQVAIVAGGAAGAYDGYEVHGARGPVLAAVGVGLLGAAGWALWRLRRNVVVVVAAAFVAALLTLAGAYRINHRINDARYLGVDPAIDTLLKVAPTGKKIGLAADWSLGGLTPIWPAFGTRIGNHVDYIGYTDGFLRKEPTEARFQAALKRGRYDVIVVGRGFYPPQNTPEQRWALDAGWRTIALSTRLRVLVPPGPA
jgi:hypothetical protein